MKGSFQNLEQLLRENPSAQRYFQQLPSYVRQILRREGKRLNTQLALMIRADQVLSGLSR